MESALKRDWKRIKEQGVGWVKPGASSLKLSKLDGASPAWGQISQEGGHPPIRSEFLASFIFFREFFLFLGAMGISHSHFSTLYIIFIIMI